MWKNIIWIVVLLVGCVPKQVRRDATTYTAEIVAGLQREHAAAAQLREAAMYALEHGDNQQCIEWLQPALVIETKAQPQAWRALYLAGLQYPLPNGELPAPDVVQEDPGPAGSVPEIIEDCGGE